MKEPGLHLSFLPPSYGPHKSSSILPLTGILFKDNLAVVHQYSLQMCTCDMQAWALQNPPWHNYPATSPAQHKQWEASPVLQYSGTRFSSKTLLHSHAATICKFAITSLHGEMSLPQLHPDYCDLNGELLNIQSNV